MVKMMEILEISMEPRRTGRVPATGANEALERYFKFRRPEFYREVEQEIKAELFPKQLNDIYDALKCNDAIKVLFAAFKLRGVAKNWWLRASDARALKDQPWTWNDF